MVGDIEWDMLPEEVQGRHISAALRKQPQLSQEQALAEAKNSLNKANEGGRNFQYVSDATKKMDPELITKALSLIGCSCAFELEEETWHRIVDEGIERAKRNAERDANPS